eukprot:10854924-Lingulodinium_polyedra.AAC.1
MMRSRGQRIAQVDEVLPLGPPWQCTAPTLLYTANASSPSLPWRSMSMEQVVAGIRDLMPTETQ